MIESTDPSDLSVITHRHGLFSWLCATGRNGVWVEVDVVA